MLNQRGTVHTVSPGNVKYFKNANRVKNLVETWSTNKLEEEWGVQSPTVAKLSRKSGLIKLIPLLRMHTGTRAQVQLRSKAKLQPQQDPTIRVN